MSLPFGQWSFSKGEIAPSLFGHIDVAGYHTAATTMRNMFVSYKGGAYSRAGTAFVGFSKQTGRAYPPRLVNFQFNIMQGLCLEFGNEYMRVISNGAFVTEAPLSITAATQASPCVLSVTASEAASATAGTALTSYAPGDTITLAGGTYITPAIITVTNTLLQSVALNLPGVRYAPHDTIVPSGGTQSTLSQITVATTQVVSSTIDVAGSGGTNGTQTVTGTTGTGTKFQASVTIAGGAIAAVLSIAVGGNYTVNPATLTAEPVTGASLTGAKLHVVMGIDTITVTNGGVFTTNPSGGAFTQASTSGTGTGATFNYAIMAPNVVDITTSGSYSAYPANPVAQASTSGTGTGVTFTMTWASAAAFSDGDWIYVSGVGGMTQLNGNIYVVSGATTGHVSLTDVYGNNINAVSFGTYTTGGTAARIYTLTTPYGEADLDYLKWTQSADVMSICCRNQVTGTEYAPMDLKRFADNNFSLVQYSTGATVQPPSNVTSASSGGSGTTYYGYQVTSIDPTNGSESVGSAITLLSGVIDIAAVAGSNSVNWSPVNGVDNYNVYKAAEAQLPIPAGSAFGYAGTVAGVSWIDSNIVPDFQQVPPLDVDPFSQGAIVDAPLTAGGVNYTAASVTINTSTGSGAVLIPVVSNGSVIDIIVQDGGRGYAPTDTLTIDGGSGQASGTITFAVNPSASDTITLNGDAWTFVSSVSGANQTQIGATLAATLAALAAQLNASGDAELVVASYAASATILGITYNTGGLAGNSYTLAASAATPSGGTLTGGGSTSGGATAVLTVGPESGTYPSVVGYYQQRRVYASSGNEPDTYWMTQPGNFSNFDYRVPTIDSDAITGSPWSLQVNGIQWLLSMPGGLLVFTGNQMWQLTGAGGSGLTPVAITPSDQQAQPQAFNGISATLPPQQIGYDVLFADAVGSNVYDVTYQYWLNIYTGTDITVFSDHLFDGFTIDQWAWCRQPNKTQWAVRSDGAALSLAFIKEQEVAGWARHDTQGLFKSVCSVIEPPVNAPYFAVQRYFPAGAAYTIERMDNRLWNAAEDCWCVDCGASLAHTYPQATLTASSATGAGALTGVTDLVGGSGYSQQTTGLVVDDDGNGPGTGAVAVLTISDGVIAGVTFSPEGENYTYPQIWFNDPSGQGRGASAVIVLDNSAIFTANANVFSEGSIGNVIRIGGGIATVTGYTSGEQITANITSPIVQTIPNSGWMQETDSGDWVLLSTVPLPQVAGNWTMDTPVTTISGLNYAAGTMVTGLADGAVISPRTVSTQGTILLDAPATQVIVGLGFQAQLQGPYASEPALQGQRKRIARMTARIEASRGLKFGANQIDASTLSPPQLIAQWKNLATAPDLGRPPYGSTIPPLYTGDIRIPVHGGFEKPGQPALQQDNPLPMQVLALIPEIDPGDLPEGPKGASRQPRENGGRQQSARPQGAPGVVVPPWASQ